MTAGFLKFGIAVAATVASLCAAQAQDWPQRPVTIIGGGAPGGSVEMTTRGFSDPMGKALGQNFLIDSKPGAGGHIANEAVSRAKPDGYTFGMTSIAPHGIGVSLYKNLNYDPKNFTFIARLVAFPNVIYVPADSPYHSIGDLVAAAKAKPGEISQGSLGVGSSTQMTGVMLMQQSDIELNHIAYKGSAPLNNAVLSGEVDVAVDNLPGVVGQVQAGSVRALGVTTPQRAPQLPDVPTVAEQGYPDFDLSSWYGLVAPKGLPDDVVAKMSGEIERILQTDEAKAYYNGLGAQIAYLPPAEFEAYVDAEIARWAPIVAASGASVN